jgi:hypothetical protein
MIKPAPLTACDDPASWNHAIAMAIKSLMTGTANSEQQKAALGWIIHEAASKNKQSYRSDPCAAAFIEGRRFVAAQIMGLVEVDLEKAKKALDAKKD